MNEMQMKLEDQSKTMQASYDKVQQENDALRQELDLLKQQHGNAFGQRHTDAEILEDQDEPLVNHSRDNNNGTDNDNGDPGTGSLGVQSETPDGTPSPQGQDNQSNMRFDVWSFFCSCCVRPDDSVTTNDDDSESTDDDECLLEDTFSFLITAHFLSIPFITGILVFLLKTTVYTLFTFDLIDRTKSFNQFGVPVSVERAVAASQLLALLISVFSKNDLVSAFIVYIRGYDASIKRHFHRDGRGGGLPWQWGLSIAMSLVDGLFDLAVTFLLIVKSSTVLDVLLNFAAVAFVAEIDEIAFTFAQMGFIGTTNKNEAELVQTTRYTPGRIYRSNKRAVRRIRKVSVLFVLMIGLSIWGEGVGRLGWKRTSRGFASAPLPITSLPLFQGRFQEGYEPIIPSRGSSRLTEIESST